EPLFCGAADTPRTAASVNRKIDRNRSVRLILFNLATCPPQRTPWKDCATVRTRGFSVPIHSECRTCPAGRTAVSGECASPSTCQLGQVGHIEVLFGPTRCAMPRQDRRALHAAPESRTPIVQRGQVPRQSLHISPAPPALPRTTGSAARLRVPTPTL